MKISDIIYQLEQIKKREGDLYCFSSSLYANSMPYVKTNSGQYPKDWDMPEKFVILGESND